MFIIYIVLVEEERRLNKNWCGWIWIKHYEHTGVFDYFLADLTLSSLIILILATATFAVNADLLKNILMFLLFVFTDSRTTDQWDSYAWCQCHWLVFHLFKSHLTINLLHLLSISFSVKVHICMYLLLPVCSSNFDLCILITVCFFTNLSASLQLVHWNRNTLWLVSVTAWSYFEETTVRWLVWMNDWMNDCFISK